MSTPQTNFELNNNARMSELTKNINDIFGYILLYSVIIFTTLSALLGGIVVYPIYGVIYIFNKIREHCCANEVEANEVEANEVATDVNLQVDSEKKPIIDENWCNVSVKNIINFESEVDISNADISNADISNADISNAEDEVDVSNADISTAEEEVLSIRRPSEEELKEEEEDESDANDYSPRDKYSIGHYKSKTHINDPLDFVE